MGVEPKIMGTPPKSSIFRGVSIINHPFWGTPVFGNTKIFAEVTIAHWFQVAGPALPEELAEALSDVHDHFAALQERPFSILIR